MDNRGVPAYPAVGPARRVSGRSHLISRRRKIMNAKVLEWFDKIVGVVSGVILALIILGIVIGVAQLFWGLVDLLRWEPIGKRYVAIITDVLTLFILIELSRSLVEYFNTHRLRMTFIVDAAIVFVLREIMLNMFEHKLTPADFYALSVLLLVLGLLRIGSILVFQRERQMLETVTSRRRNTAGASRRGQSPAK